MRTTARSYVTAGVALMGAGVISATPVTPSLDLQTKSYDVGLIAATQSCTAGSASALCASPAGIPSAAPFATTTDSTNVLNIPANLFIALANVPYNFFNALGEGDVALGSDPNGDFSFQPTYEGVTLTQPEGSVVGLGRNLRYTGNWWVYSQTNILGTDPADPSRYQALTNVLVPFPALSVPLGNIVAAVAASQLPMDTGCTGTGPGSCDHPEAILSKMFDLRHVVALFSPDGYTYPETRAGITCSADGQCYVKDEDGPEVPWSGQTVKLDATAPFTSFYDSLTKTPDFSEIKPVTPQFVAGSLTSLANGLNTDFNPFVLGTQCTVCAPFVPNPDNKPIPGPVFTDPDSSAPTTAASDVTNAGPEEKAAAATPSLKTPSLKTPSLETPAVDTDAAPDTTDTTGTTSGPKHRKPTTTSTTIKQVRDSIDATVSKVTDRLSKKPTSASEASASSAKSSATGGESKASGSAD
ncbi:hypothetical protein FK535_27170 [Mycolicibacterium sp. 018/SC-01/001]|uniref:hypothetical protein n=1 Tax=Mycolicibacterium sp. 018/SC-01/001 TaxID=2592069 RepID=UPI00117E33E5|nr:hypothetical protein [Mycolicibacterium sp. 018/SC-01/001]TRW77019.1 hypothetical protein FK535_27170 [Mycolicibacterium sp. 018/SC-01/001]